MQKTVGLFILFFLNILLTVHFALAQGNDSEWTPRSPLEYSSSLHSLLMRAESNRVKTFAESPCVEAIRNFLSSGRNFYSPLMERDYTLPVSRSESTQRRGNMFFHYTNAIELFDISRTQNFDTIFSFIRNKTYELFFYVAADPESSKGGRAYLFELNLRSNAKIFVPGKMASEPSELVANSHLGDFEIQKEQAAKSNELNVCVIEASSLPNPHSHSILALLAAEANQIDLIAYFGKDNGWYQVLGEWSIQSMRPGTR